MESVANRRTFVRNMIVGVPVLAATTSFPTTVVGFSPHDAHLPPTIDATVHDLTRLHNEIQQRGSVRPADLHAIAAHVRTLGTRQLESNRNVELVRNIRELIARDGRQSIIDHTPDPETMRQELVSAGFDLRSAPVGVIGTDRRADALDRLARGGLAPAYFEIGEIIIAGDDGGSGFYLVPGSTSTSICATLREMLTMIESVAAVMCTLALMLPPAIPDCFAASSTLATLKLLILLLGC
jgi:hypothetical protein